VPFNNPILERLDMLSQGSGLFRVDSKKRSAQENDVLKKHPWRTRLHAYLHEAGEFGADWVYFRLSVGAGAPKPELFIYDFQDDGLGKQAPRSNLATLYHQLWNYGRVPLALILSPTKVDVYNLLPQPEFDEHGNPKEPQQIESLSLTPADSIALAAAAAKGLAAASQSAWKRFSARQFDSGAFWEAEENQNLARGANSLDSMVLEMRDVRRFLEKHTRIDVSEEHKNWFVRRLIIITLMVRFLEDRKILPADYFKDQEFVGAENFTSLLLHPRALLRAISRLENDFNGDVFHIDPVLREILGTVDGSVLTAIANFAAGDMEGQQQHFWKRYSFQYLPVEVISYVYEDFLGGKSQAYFTPHHLVDLLLDEAMPEKEVFTAIESADPRNKSSIAAYPVLDPACGSGVFLVGAWRRLVDAFLLLDKSPAPEALKKLMTDNLFGVDTEKESVELTIFSLCVALCSEFPHRPDDSSYVFNQLKELKFPNLKKLENIFKGDFFARRESILKNKRRFRLVIGNPPFESKLEPGIQSEFDITAKDEDGKNWSPVPDDQISYLFLRGIIPLVSDRGTVCLIQPAGLIYNEKPAKFRRQLFSNWQVSQVLDFASISGLFTTRKRIKKTKENGKGSKVGVKTVAIFVHRAEPDEAKPLLHATFRRTALLNQRLVFEIDAQDIHWIPKSLASSDPRVWKANLLGGGRLLEAYKSLISDGTLSDYIKSKESSRGWVCSEGFNIGTDGAPYKDLYGKPFLKTEALTVSGVADDGIIPCPWTHFVFKGKPKLFEPPHLIIKEHEELPALFRSTTACGLLSFNKELVGIKCPPDDASALRQMYLYLKENRKALQMFLAFSPRYLVGRQTALLKKDIMDLPYPEDGKIIFRGVQKYLRDDVINFMIPLIKDTEETSKKLSESATETNVKNYAKVFGELMQSVYPDFRFAGVHDLDTGWCVAFHKGNDRASTFGDTEALRKHIDALLSRETGRALRTWRIVRHFSGKDLYIIKPKPRRYWLKSAAVRDADQIFAWVMKRAVGGNVKKTTKAVTI
jgi:hypothetical protein